MSAAPPMSALVRMCVLLSAACAGFLACSSPPCKPQLCAGCCNSEGQCVEGQSLSACGMQGNACMRCNSGQTCALGVCLGGNLDTYVGEEGGGGEGEGEGEGNPEDTTPTSALWWVDNSDEEEAILNRYFPDVALHAQFHFTARIGAFAVTHQGQRWAVALAPSGSQYEIRQAFHGSIGLVHSGDGVPRKMAFAEDGQGLAFLATDALGRGRLWASADPQAAFHNLSFSACGHADDDVDVVDFALSPDSAHVAVLARLGAEPRAGVWLLGTSAPNACTTVLRPQEAQGTSAEWGALAPLQWGNAQSFYFRAALLAPHAVALYSSGLDGTRTPVSFPGEVGSLAHFAFSPDASWLALLQENAPVLRFFSLSPPAAFLPGAGCEGLPSANVQSLRFSQNGERLLLLADGRTHLIRLEDKACSLSPARAVVEAAWSPDGRALAELVRANSAEWAIRLSRYSEGQLLNTAALSVPLQHPQQLRWTAFAAKP